MNWKRIWSGALFAGTLILAFDLVTIPLLAHSGVFRFELPNVIQAYLDGFFCSCLYAVVRPRLGPGPKTALIVGTAIYFMKYGLSVVWILAKPPHNTTTALIFSLAWMKLYAATYIAGWQYIEKAP